MAPPLVSDESIVGESLDIRGRPTSVGIRLALDAREGEIYRLVLNDGISVAAIGVALGLLASVALTRVVATLLFQESATDAKLRRRLGAAAGHRGAGARRELIRASPCEVID